MGTSWCLSNYVLLCPSWCLCLPLSFLLITITILGHSLVIQCLSVPPKNSERHSHFICNRHIWIQSKGPLGADCLNKLCDTHTLKWYSAWIITELNILDGAEGILGIQTVYLKRGPIIGFHFYSIPKMEKLQRGTQISGGGDWGWGGKGVIQKPCGEGTVHILTLIRVRKICMHDEMSGLYTKR